MGNFGIWRRVEAILGCWDWSVIYYWGVLTNLDAILVIGAFVGDDARVHVPLAFLLGPIFNNESANGGIRVVSALDALPLDSQQRFGGGSSVTTQR